MESAHLHLPACLCRHSSTISYLAHTGSFLCEAPCSIFCHLIGLLGVVVFILHVKCSVWLGFSRFEYLYYIFVLRLIQVLSGKPETKISPL